MNMLFCNYLKDAILEEKYKKALEDMQFDTSDIESETDCLDIAKIVFTS